MTAWNRYLIANGLVFVLGTLMMVPLCSGEDAQAREPRDGRGRGNGQVDRWLNDLTQTQPERARELRKLRDSDPEQFRKEIRQDFGGGADQMRGRQQPDRGFAGGERDGGGPRGPREFGERARQHFDRQLEKYMAWLEQNYPEEAERLSNLREKSPESYFGELRQSMRTYGSIMEREDRNPELAEVLKRDLQLQKQRDELLKELKSARGEREEEISAQLRSVVEERFDIILKKKELRYKELLERLERLKAAVENHKSQLDQLQEQKQSEIDTRMQQLLGESEGIDWN